MQSLQKFKQPGAPTEQNAARIPQAAFWIRLVWWAIFAGAFGYCEAAVVVYIRRLTGMAPGLDYAQIMAARHIALHSAGVIDEMRRQNLLNLEISREIATIVLLLAASCAAGRTMRERWGFFLYTFAVWDLTYYLFLALLIGFPRRLTDIDVYFLVPIVWYGPVWFPVLIVMPALIILALRLMRRDRECG